MTLYRRVKLFIKSGYNCKQKITKWHNSMENVGGAMVLVLCTPSDVGLYLNRNFVNMFSAVFIFGYTIIPIKM